MKQITIVYDGIDDLNLALTALGRLQDQVSQLIPKIQNQALEQLKPPPAPEANSTQTEGGNNGTANQ